MTVIDAIVTRYTEALTEHHEQVSTPPVRGLKVITATEAGELLPRSFAQADHFECKFCSYAERCWGGTV